MKIKGRWRITINGKVYEGTNQETLVLGRLSIQALTGVLLSAFQYLAIGTGTTTPAPEQTALVAEVLRALGTMVIETTVNSDDTLHITAQFISGAGLDIFEIGVFDAASVGNMAARTVFTDSDGVPEAINIPAGSAALLEYFLQAL